MVSVLIMKMTTKRRHQINIEMENLSLTFKCKNKQRKSKEKKIYAAEFSFTICYPMQGNLGIQKVFAYGIQNPTCWNSDPTLWNMESRILENRAFGIQNPWR